MEREEAFQDLCKKLLQIYGPEEGLRTVGIVAAGILGDFSKMLEKAKAGTVVAETYHTEDGKATIRLEATKGTSSKWKIEVKS